MSVIFMPGHLVRQFHVRQFHAWTFRWSVIFMSVIFSAPISEIYTLKLRMFRFFWFFRSPTGEAVGRILTLNTSYDAVLQKEVPIGDLKFECNI